MQMGRYGVSVSSIYNPRVCEQYRILIVVFPAINRRYLQNCLVHLNSRSILPYSAAKTPLAFD